MVHSLACTRHISSLRMSKCHNHQNIDLRQSSVAPTCVRTTIASLMILSFWLHKKLKLNYSIIIFVFIFFNQTFSVIKTCTIIWIKLLCSSFFTIYWLFFREEKKTLCFKQLYYINLSKTRWNIWVTRSKSIIKHCLVIWWLAIFHVYLLKECVGSDNT